jgi:hypothetical protein
MRALYVLLVAALASACATHPAVEPRSQTELSKFEENLKLSLSPEQNQVIPGRQLAVKFTLHNSGSEDLEPCLAERGGIQFFGLDQHYLEAAELSVVDHPFCKTPLSVASGESVSWSKEIRVPSLPSSTAKLVASIYLVPTSGCDHLGCDGISLSAEASPITVTSEASRR